LDRCVPPSRAGRAAGRVTLLLTAAAAFAVAASSPAGAAIGPVHVSPSSGPPGTTFTVSGSGCGPGLFVSGSDYVSVSSTGLPLNVHAAVNRAGAWSTTFHIPNGAPPVPALIAAGCFTDGLPSLTTIYTPATFLVTALPTPTTAPPPPPTGPTTSGSTGTTATTKGTTASSEPRGTGGGTATASGSASGSGAGKSGRARGSGPGSDVGRAGSAGSSANSRAGPRSGAVAGLRSPELTSESDGVSSGISPWWWTLLGLLVAGGIGAWLWLRRRGATTPDAPADPGPGPDDESGGADPDNALADDWPAFPVLDDESPITR
jgi:hypothetical protein